MCRCDPANATSSDEESVGTDWLFADYEEPMENNRVSDDYEEPVEKDCLFADEGPVEDDGLSDELIVSFEALLDLDDGSQSSKLDDADMLSLMQDMELLHESDEDIRIDWPEPESPSSLDSSTYENETSERNDVSRNYPYVPMSVGEVSVVTSLECWTNTKVRVVGRYLVSDFDTYTLCGMKKDKGVIRLNLVLVDQYPKHGEILEIFGELQNFQESGANVIMLRVMFFNRVQNIYWYTKGLSLLKPYVPSFVKRNQ